MVDCRGKRIRLCTLVEGYKQEGVVAKQPATVIDHLYLQTRRLFARVLQHS